MRPAPGGVVAAGHSATADAAAALLTAGGNAIDAVVAAAAASWVAEPCLTSAGGGGMLLMGDGASWEAVDCFGMVPGTGLDAARNLDFHEIAVDFGPVRQTFHVGRGSVAVPGLLAGLLDVHRRAGRAPLTDVLAPAVHLARSGVALTEAIAFMLRIIEPIAQLTPGTRTLFGCHNGMPGTGTVLTNPDLAGFLEALGHDDAQAIGDLWVPGLLQTFGPDQGGRLTSADLRAWAPVSRPARATPFANGVAFTMPPPVSGGDIVAVGLRAADRLGLPSKPRTDSSRWADIARCLAAQAAARGTHITTLDDRTIDAWLSAVPGRESRVAGNTTHVSVMDGNGQFAALTHSNGEGCGHVVQGLGVHLNNFLGEEDINPLGFHIAPPGSTLSTAMAPTAWVRGADVVVVGSGGSKRIRSAIAQVLIHIASGDTPAAAIAAPRLHVEGSQLSYEAQGLPNEAEETLRARWPNAVRFDEPSMFFGGVHAVGRSNHEPWAAADGRRGAAVRFALTAQ